MSLQPLKEGNNTRCMRCHTWIFKGTTFVRGEDSIFVCFECRNSTADIETLINEVREQCKDDESGLLQLNLEEKEVHIINAILQEWKFAKNFKIGDEVVFQYDVHAVVEKIRAYAAVLAESTAPSGALGAP